MNMAPPRRDNSAVWWILGIVVGGIVIMMVFGLALAAMFVHRIHVKESAKNVEIQTPVGELKVNSDSAHATGLPIYPGATPSSDNGKSARIELNATGGSGVGLAVETYRSDDSLEEVAEWYQKQLGPNFRRENGDQISDMPSMNEHKADLAFVDDHGNGARVIALTKEEDDVKIALIRVGKRETQ